MEGRHVIATSSYSTKLMTELYTFAIRTQKGFSLKTSMIPLVALHGCCCPHGIQESTCTTLLAFLLTITGVLDIDCNVMTLATPTTCSSFSVCTAIIFPSVSLMSYVVVRLSTGRSYTVSIYTGCQLYIFIFLSAGRFF